MWWSTMLIAVAVAAVLISTAGPVLRLLPAPSGLGDDEPLPWQHLPTPRWLCGLGLASALTAGIALIWAPSHSLVLWLVWAAPAALLVAIDAATTWLPRSLNAVCAVLLVTVAVGQVALAAMPAHQLVTMAVAAIIATGVFWGLWRWSGGALGFGDVRLAPLVAVVAGSVSGSFVVTAFLVGSLLGVLAGVVARLLGNRGAFAYGPALWAGPPVALVITRVAEQFG